MNTIWDILGILPTSDKRAIKKAYAAKCAFCHPEEQPEEFDRLHKAYTSAIRAAGQIREEGAAGWAGTGAPGAGEVQNGESPGIPGRGEAGSGEKSGAAGTGEAGGRESFGAAGTGEAGDGERSGAAGTGEPGGGERSGAAGTGEPGGGERSGAAGTGKPGGGERSGAAGTDKPGSGESSGVPESHKAGSRDKSGKSWPYERISGEKAAVPGTEDAERQEDAGKTSVSQPTASSYSPPPQPEIPSISQLVEQGMEQEIKSAARKLLESFKKLHASFPKSVNTDEEELAKALRYLDQWFDSPRFKLAGWEPVFLKQLNQWLSRNRKRVNRAEAVALYKGYRFKDYGSPTYPFAAHIGDVRREVMRQSLRYEEDMVRMAGMPQPRLKSGKAPKKYWSLLRQAALCVLLLFTVVMVGIYLGSRYSPSADLQEIAREKIRSTSEQRPYVLTEEAPEETGSPQESSLIEEREPVCESWIYDGAGPVKRPESQPFSPADYEYYGKNQLTAAYKSAMPFVKSGNTASSPLMAVTAGLTGIQVSGSYLSQNQECDGVYYYSLEALGKTAVEFPVWVVPAGTDFTGAPAYAIGGCGYWAEALRAAALKEEILGRTWYDGDRMAHLVLMWDSVQTLPHLTERLLEMSGSYYETVQGDSPTIYLTILMGPEADRGADLLEEASESLPVADQKDSCLMTITENELLAQKGESPVPITSGGPSMDLSLYDGSLQWIARIPMEKDGSNGAFHPGLTQEEVQEQVLNGITGLDWALSRFEISMEE